MGHRNPALASAVVLAGAGIVAQLSFAVALRAQRRADAAAAAAETLSA
jgi:DHA1 family bicyclomycin/chloramphenicol resistance-like MFS transporter